MGGRHTSGVRAEPRDALGAEPLPFSSCHTTTGPEGLDPLKTGLCPVTSLEAYPTGVPGPLSEGGGNTRALEPGLLTAGPISQGDSSRLGLYHSEGVGGSMAAEAP